MKIQEETITRRFIEYNGYRFYPDKRGYWLGHPKENGRPVRLHVYVWETERGPIPEGYHVHHIDHNPDNNEIENLQLIPKSEHLKYHSGLQDKAWARQNMLDKAIPAAAAWRKSEEGKAWQKKHNKEVMQKRANEKVEKVCQVCGQTYLVPEFCAEGSRFCSNSCKSKWRRDSGLDNFETSCVICGKKFLTNKYDPARYCSNECRIIGRKKYWEARRKSKDAQNVISES